MSARLPHDWFEARIPAYLSGLLDGADERRLEDHVSACTSCRERLEEAERALSERASEAHHIPAEVLGTWPRSAPGLRGIEREAVRRHLERCPECREDLELLGYEPRLEVVPDLEAGAWPAPPGGPTSEVFPATDRGRTRDGRRPTRGPRRWLPWAVGGWAAAATAAAIVLLAMPPRQLPSPAGPVGIPPRQDIPPAEPVAPAPTPAGPPSAPPASPGVSWMPQPVELQPPLRGGDGEDLARVLVRPEQPAILLELPAQSFFPDEVSSLRVEVIGPDGDVMAVEAADPRDFASRRLLSIARGSSGWRPGRHAVRLVLTPTPSALVHEVEVREFPFELSLRPN